MTALSSYLATISSPMHRAKAEAALVSMVRVNGASRLVARHEVITARVEAGAAVVERRGERVLMSENGAWFDAANITKTGIAFAEWLISERAR